MSAFSALDSACESEYTAKIYACNSGQLCRQTLDLAYPCWQCSASFGVKLVTFGNHVQLGEPVCNPLTRRYFGD